MNTDVFTHKGRSSYDISLLHGSYTFPIRGFYHAVSQEPRFFDHWASHHLQNLLKNYEAQLPPDIVQAIQAASTGSVAADPLRYDSEYLSPVDIGTPSQAYMMEPDTGSAVFLVDAPKLGTSGKTATETADVGGTVVTGQAVTITNDASENIVGLA